MIDTTRRPRRGRRCQGPDAPADPLAAVLKSLPGVQAALGTLGGRVGVLEARVELLARRLGRLEAAQEAQGGAAAPSADGSSAPAAPSPPPGP
jgi:hypothetical protein